MITCKKIESRLITIDNNGADEHAYRYDILIAPNVYNK